MPGIPLIVWGIQGDSRRLAIDISGSIRYKNSHVVSGLTMFSFHPVELEPGDASHSPNLS